MVKNGIIIIYKYIHIFIILKSLKEALFHFHINHTFLYLCVFLDLLNDSIKISTI